MDDGNATDLGPDEKFSQSQLRESFLHSFSPGKV